MVEVDLGCPLYGTEREQCFKWLRRALQTIIKHSLVGSAQHQGILKKNSQRVDVDVEREHNASGEEGVGLAMVAWEERQPHFHPCLTAGQPQRLH